MITTPAKDGYLFLCALGHIDHYAKQERTKRAKACNKIGCAMPVQQVRIPALRRLYLRGKTSAARLLDHFIDGKPL